MHLVFQATKISTSHSISFVFQGNRRRQGERDGREPGAGGRDHWQPASHGPGHGTGDRHPEPSDGQDHGEGAVSPKLPTLLG